MTSMQAESVTTIQCTSKQTRFNIGVPNYRELDIEGLNITVTSAPSSKPKGTSSSSAGGKKTGKSKARSEGTEILDNATLRLKAGQRYALIGRNGSGKSTLLKAIAQKLIPGIPEETRIVILQQTDAGEVEAETDPEQTVSSSSDRSVLEEVIERATARHEAQREIEDLSQGVESTSPLAALRSLRKIRRERLQRDLFLKAKDARLRSGARGMQARKALIVAEKTVAEFDELYAQKDEEISPETLAKETSEAAEMLAELQLQVEPSKMAEVESRAKKLLTGLGFSEAGMGKPVSSLSGGWKMRTALAAALLQETDILILDEPTNFLDLLGILWLQRYLTALGESADAPTLIVVSHDRDFISLCTDLLILKAKGITYFHGDLPTYEEAQGEKKIHLTKMKEAQDRQKEHIQQTPGSVETYRWDMQNDLEGKKVTNSFGRCKISIQKNMREGKAKDDQNKIRQAKSRQKKLDDRWGLERSAHGGRFKLNRDLAGYHLTSRAEIEIPQDERPVSFVLPEPADLRFPGALISLDKTSFRYPRDPKTKAVPPLVLQGVTLSVHMGDRVGILGLNGGGKSTLVKLLVGETKPSSGTLTLHPRLKIGYYSQHAVEKLQEMGVSEPDLTALGLLSKEMAATEQEEGRVRGLLASLGLPGRLASDVPIRKLSGGQLVRLEMARILWTCPHCLILDEATTHLDYETVTAMREALRDWEGAVVVVSHDRWFMRGVVEGHVDGEGSDLSDEEEEIPRRRLVYRLRAGEMSELTSGVQQFEASLEKRVAKLIDS
ncbi:ABC transporter [Xylaria sp. FL0933]|nr:ABC transporter [Xylaria sp. FL0933]